MTLDIENVDPDEILILTSISGLSQAGATLFTGEFASEGGYYQGRRAKQRFPVLNFKINPDYANDVTASEIRDMLYRIFMEPSATSDMVQVGLFDDKFPELYFIGITEDIEADQFAQELKASVSMSCTDPYLRSAVETQGANSSGWLSLPVIYEGSADTGFQVLLKVLSNTSEINLENNGQVMRLLGNFLAGDFVSINTQPQQRQIQHNFVDSMAALQGSNWLKLGEKTNLLKAYGTVAGDGKAVIIDYRYRAAWWGI
jgi:hypothetical protein